MSQQSLLELAKQGDARAITILFNRQLQPKGISAKASLTGDCLQIILEAASAPAQKAVVTYIRNVMNKLGASSIRKIMVYGKQTGNDFPVWHQEIELQSIQSVDSSTTAKKDEIVPTDTSIQSFSIVHSATNSTILECHGDCTVLVVKESGVLINRLGGFLNSHAKGERFISYKDIANIQFHESGVLSYGFIHFQIKGLPYRNIKHIEAASNPDAVVFFNDKLGEFEQARLLIADAIGLSERVERSLDMGNTAIQQSGQGNPPSANLEVQIQCPKCGSTQINANKKGFHVGQALVGGVFTLGVGVAAGFWGSNKIRLNCLRCGHRWKPNM